MSEENKDAPPPYPGGPDPTAPGQQQQYNPQQYSQPQYGQQYGQQYPPTSQAYGPPASQGYGPPTSQGYAYSYPSQTQGGGVTVVQGQPVATQAVIVRAGNCPNCRAGILVDQFTCCGILMAIFFFPIGFICCLMMRRNVCTNCGAAF